MMTARIHAFGVVTLICSAALAQTAATAPAGDNDAKYNDMIGKRADEAVSAVSGLDSAKAAGAKAAVEAYYRDLKKVDEDRDAAIKGQAKNSPEATKAAADRQEQAKAVVKKMADALAVDLSAEQVDAIKDKIVYNTRQVTYRAYLEEIPKLTDEQKKYIADQLLEARDLALTGGSSKEKHNWFDKYKGRINNYLSKQGYDMKAEGAAWQERIKTAATQNK